jgi:catalase
MAKSTRPKTSQKQKSAGNTRATVSVDAMVLPSGVDAVRHLRMDGRTLEFIKDQSRHCKPILAFGEGGQLLEACGIGPLLPSGGLDPGLISATPDAEEAADDFIAALAKHRHFGRETDPPSV